MHLSWFPIFEEANQIHIFQTNRFFCYVPRERFLVRKRLQQKIIMIKLFWGTRKPNSNSTYQWFRINFKMIHSRMFSLSISNVIDVYYRRAQLTEWQQRKSNRIIISPFLLNKMRAGQMLCICVRWCSSSTGRCGRWQEKRESEKRDREREREINTNWI